MFLDVSMVKQSLLSSQSAKERESKKLSEEILSLLSKPTAKVIVHPNICDKNSYTLSFVRQITSSMHSLLKWPCCLLKRDILKCSSEFFVVR